jgi:signal transduction histidine kinase
LISFDISVSVTNQFLERVNGLQDTLEAPLLVSLPGDIAVLRSPLAQSTPRFDRWSVARRARCSPAAFSTNLPGRARRVPMGPSLSVTPKKATDKLNILLVDDQQAKLLSHEVILAGIGETLIKAGSACEAFECLLKNEVALILIDVCMPDLDGFKLAALIREHPRFQRTGIIFVSAVSTTHLDQLRGYNLGAFDYIPVPVTPELLRAKVRVFMDLYRKTRELERCNAELEQRVLERTSDLRRLNEELEARIEERTREREKVLAQLFEARKADAIGAWTGEVAHDFNNLLMAVVGSLRLLQKRLPDDPQDHRLLRHALQGGERGASLAQRLLAFSRRQEVKPQSVDIGSLVGGMKELLERAVGAGVELECRFPSGLSPVRVDANQLELALLNLALNARDAMPRGGRLTISAEETGNAQAADSSLLPGDYVRINMVDTGVGMDEGMRTGLGVSVVHDIATQSGGVLRIDSAPDVGTAVELWLPQYGGYDGLRSQCRTNCSS